MTASTRWFLALGSVSALVAVVLGAFGAHALKTRVSADLMAVYQTGVLYHLVHSLGLLAVGLVAIQLPGSALVRAAGGSMLAGVILFSGSLYVLALTGTRAWGMITPFGGVAFILGWALLAYAVVRA